MSVDDFIKEVKATEDHDIFTPRVFYHLDRKMFEQMCKILKEQESELEEYHKADNFLAIHGWWGNKSPCPVMECKEENVLYINGEKELNNYG